MLVTISFSRMKIKIIFKKPKNNILTFQTIKNYQNRMQIREVITNRPFTRVKLIFTLKTLFLLVHNFIFMHENENINNKKLKRKISTFQKTKNYQNRLRILGVRAK